MFVVDNHIHLGQPGVHVSEHVYKQLRKNWSERGFRYHSTEVKSERRDGEMLVHVMDEVGIDVCCVLAGNWNRVLKPEHRPYDVPNDFVAKQVAASNGRLIGICSADPIVDPWGAADELERCVRDLDFRGIKLYPTYAHFDPRDKACDPLYEAATALGVPLPNTAMAQELFNACVAHGGLDWDHSAMVRALEKMANFEMGQAAAA